MKVLTMCQAVCQMLHVLTHLIFMTILEHRYYYSPHFIDEEDGVIERLNNLPSWHSKMEHQDLNSGSLFSVPELPYH